MQNAECKHPNGQITKETCLILELAPNGELLEYVCLNGKLNEPICKYIFK